MSIDFTNVQVPFTDFCLLAVLLAILYAVSVFEVWFAPQGQVSAGIPRVNRQLAATWAFAGIIVTLIVGFVAAADTGNHDYFYLLIPMAFIIRWAIYHYLSSNKLIELQYILQEIDKTYQESLFRVLSNKKGKTLTVEEIHRLALEYDLFVDLMDKATRIVKFIAPIGVQDSISKLAPTAERTRKLLRMLEKEKKIKYHDDDTYTAL